MHILVTGSRGQLAQCLQQAVRQSHSDTIKLSCLSRPEFDLSDNDSARAAVTKALHLLRPDLIIHAAAYTAVDRAETEASLAMQVNTQGAALIAQISAEHSVPVIMISTDYVFSGKSRRPYKETDAPNPINIYGQSKLAGEQAVIAANPHHLIMRTSWVYSFYAQNFVKTMLQLAKTRDEISVVCDQYGNPTSAHDLAQALLYCARIFINNRQYSGLYHLTGNGITNRSEFARQIMRLSLLYGGSFAVIKDIESKNFPTNAMRPTNTSLDCEKFNADFGWQMPCWQHALETLLATLSTATA